MSFGEQSLCLQRESGLRGCRLKHKKDCCLDVSALGADALGLLDHIEHLFVLPSHKALEGEQRDKNPVLAALPRRRV